jgi:predicted amidophosphoribosyltransferase
MPIELLRDLTLGLLAPPLCLCCRTPLPAAAPGPALCEGCSTEIALAASVRLRGDGIDGGIAALPYRGAGRRLVAALKFSRLRPAATLGARLIVSRAPAELLAAPLVPVPAAPLRMARRGIDPPGELAAALSTLAGERVVPLLRRRDRGRQRGRSRGERLARPPTVVAAEAAPDRVVLVDDVVTTGATLTACARALRAAGTSRIAAVALAAAPPPRAPGFARTRRRT